MANDKNEKKNANSNVSDRRTSVLMTVTVFVPLIQFLALIMLPVLFPEISVVAWSILLIFLILTLVLSIMVNSVLKIGSNQSEHPAKESIRIVGEPLFDSSLRDPVTKMFNRNYLEKTLEHELEQSLLDQKSVGVMRLEVDHFEEITATYGSSLSVALLQEIADYLRQSVRVSDIACRVDDQGFILVLFGVSLELTLERAEQLQAKVRKIKLEQKDQTFDEISLSIGVVFCPEQGTTADALLENAEIALQQAKSQQANSIIVCEND